jgi:hypothetical protein
MNNLWTSISAGELFWAEQMVPNKKMPEQNTQYTSGHFDFSTTQRSPRFYISSMHFKTAATVCSLGKRLKVSLRNALPVSVSFYMIVNDRCLYLLSDDVKSKNVAGLVFWDRTVPKTVRSV